MAGRQNRDTERRLLADRSDEDAIVRRGALDSASARAYISSIEKDNDKAVEAINNSLTSSGATVANELAARQAANENRQKAVARVLDSEENEKASARRNRRYIDNQIGELNTQKARNWMDIASGIAGAAGNLGYAYLDGGTTPLINQQSKIGPVSTSKLEVESPIPQEIKPLEEGRI